MPRSISATRPRQITACDFIGRWRRSSIRPHSHWLDFLPITALITRMSIFNLTSKQLRRAAQLKDQVAELQNELNNILGAGRITLAKTAKSKRKMSKAARAKI